MQKLPIISAGVALALLGITVFVALRDELSVSSGVPAVLFPANDSRLPVELPSPSAVVYRAAPDTIPVLAPKPVDEPIVDYPPFWGDLSRLSRVMSRFKAIPSMPPNPALDWKESSHCPQD